VTFFSLANLKRLFMILAVVAVIAVMTGTPGSSTASPTTGVHGSFLNECRGRTFRGAPLVVVHDLRRDRMAGCFVVSPRARMIRRGIDTVLAFPKELTTKRSTRVALIVVALVVVILLPKFVHESFWMYSSSSRSECGSFWHSGLTWSLASRAARPGLCCLLRDCAYTTGWLTAPYPRQPSSTIRFQPSGSFPSAFSRQWSSRPLGTPTLRLRGDYLAIVTLGFALIIDDFVETQSGVTAAGGSAAVPHPALNLGFWHFHWGITPTPYYYSVSSHCHLHHCLTSLEHSRIGRAWVAIREDEVAAESVGINPLKYKVMAFTVGAASGGFGAS